MPESGRSGSDNSGADRSVYLSELHGDWQHPTQLRDRPRLRRLGYVGSEGDAHHRAGRLHPSCGCVRYPQPPQLRSAGEHGQCSVISLRADYGHTLRDERWRVVTSTSDQREYYLLTTQSHCSRHRMMTQAPALFVRRVWSLECMICVLEGFTFMKSKSSLV